MTDRRVPIWCFLITLVVLLCSALQIFAEVSLHGKQHSAFVQSLISSADGISQNLIIFQSDIYTNEEAEQALIGACLYAEHLEDLFYRVPRYTILGFERGLFEELGNSPLQTFSFVASQLREILNEYQEKNILSAESLSSIQLISHAFSSFLDNLEEQSTVSQKSLINYMDILCTDIYP